MKHGRTQLSNRIWRAVVASSAMLAAPVAYADLKKPTPTPTPQKVQPAQTDTVESLTAAIAAVDKQIEEATKAVQAAQTENDRKAAGQKLSKLQGERRGLDFRLQQVRHDAEVKRAQAAVTEAEARVGEAQTAVGAARDDAARKQAKAELDAAKKALAEAQTKLRVISAKRPRGAETTPADRPRGRGFVLS